jgi:hypothetical protein
MKTVKFVAYLFYRYYSTGATKDIPYASALCALVLLFYIHLVQLLLVLNLINLIPINDSDTRIEKFFKIAFFLLPLFLFFIIAIRKKELESLQYDEQKIKTGYVYLIIYIILSFSFMIFLALLRAGKI